MRDKLIDRFIANRQIDLDHEMDQAVNELTVQLKVVVEQLQKMTTKSEEHEQVLAFLQQKAQHTTEAQKPTVEQQLTVDLFRIPDPIKSIPEYDGNRKQLSAWIKTAEDTLNVFAPLVSEPQFKLYLQAVSNKIRGKAKDAICLAGNPQNFEEIKQILLETLGDKQELSFYKSQLWATKQSENTTVHTYFQKIKENVQNIKTLARQNATYSYSWTAINAFIEEDALAAFISGLRKPYFGYAQAAKPKTIEEAYAFLCKFNSNEIISGNSRKPINHVPPPQPKFNNSYQKPKEWNENNQVYKRPGSIREKATPMDVDVSMRSRNTFNKKMVNTHEINAESEESENLPNELDVNATNFQDDQVEDTED